MMRLLLIAGLLFSAPIMAEESSPGQQLFEGYCALCHQLPDPEMLNAKQWQRVMLTMQKRMQQREMEPLNDEQFELILSYLKQQGE